MPSRFPKLHDNRPALPRPLRHASKVLPVLGLGACLYLLSHHLSDFDVSQLGLALGQLTAIQWISACLLTGVSFAAVGQYDAVIHRVLGTGVAPGRARAAGVRAIALSQTVGFSSLSGGLVRLRCLPELDLWTVSRLSVLVSLSFLASWAVLAGGVVLWGQTGPTALIILFLGLIGWRVARFRPDSTLPGLSPFIGPTLLLWTTIDTCAAALVLGVLLPPELMPEFQTLFAAFLLSLGAGLLSQSPAGLGAFELALLVLLPQIEQASLLAAVLAYRAIYFLLPALIALALLIKPATVPQLPALQTADGSTRLRALARAPQADWSLVHQGAEIALNRDQSAGWLLRMTGRCLVALGRPLGRADLLELRDLAARRGRAAVLYKSDARTAARARRQGWHVIKIAQDAVIHLADWSIDQPRCRQLRRKLRSLTGAGVRIECAPPHLPLTDMAVVAGEWAARNGGEKGFSMGQFDPQLLAQQQVILAYANGRLVAFASFHTGRDNWVLDLMRCRTDAPCGTMHGLIHAGILAATRAGMAQISLAAVPLWPGHLARLSSHIPGLNGLHQFKGGFAPSWQTLYLCSPSLPGLVIAAISVTCAIHADPWLQWICGAKRWSARKAHQDHAYFQFETGPQACDAQGVISRAAVIAHPAERPQLTGRPDDKRPFPPA